MYIKSMHRQCPKPSRSSSSLISHAEKGATPGIDLRGQNIYKNISFFHDWHTWCALAHVLCPPKTYVLKTHGVCALIHCLYQTTCAF